MKTLSSAMLVIFFASSFTNAQFKQNSWEFGLNGSFGSITSEYSHTYGGGSMSLPTEINSSHSATYVIFSINPAYYFLDGFSLEPEFGIFANEDESPALYFIGNLSYTYLLPSTKLALFGRAGYGVSNSILYGNMYEQSPFFKIRNKMDMHVFNFGVGIK